MLNPRLNMERLSRHFNHHLFSLYFIFHTSLVTSMCSAFLVLLATQSTLYYYNPCSYISCSLLVYIYLHRIPFSISTMGVYAVLYTQSHSNECMYVINCNKGFGPQLCFCLWIANNLSGLISKTQKVAIWPWNKNTILFFLSRSCEEM